MKHNRKGLLPAWLNHMLLGLAISWAVSLAICMLCAALIASGTIHQTASGYCALIALLIGAFSGAWIPRKRNEGKGRLWCLAQGAAYFFSLLLVGTILFQEPVSGIGATALVTLGGGGLCALCGKRQKNSFSQRYRRHKRKALV